MLSAVENFGPAAVAAPPPHVYAHHNPFAIAAAAAAASSAAAAAAAVMPTQSQQTSLEHYTIAHSPLLASQQQSLNNSGIYLSPPGHHHHHLSVIPPPLQQSQNSPTISISQQQINSNPITSVVTAMSSTEFARPHPKQPRYNNNSNSSSNSSSNNNNNNNNSNNNNNISNNGISSLPMRNSKISNNNCLTSSASRSKYAAEQSGPVNLATNNSNNNNNNINNNSNENLHNSSNNNNSHNTVSPPSVEALNGGGSGSNQQPSVSESDVMAGIYAQKLPFTAPAVVTNAAAVAAAAYQFNYPHIYGRGAMYGTSALYPGHHPLSSRSQLHSRPTFIGVQHEPFSPYLPSVTYSPPSVPAPPPGLLRPPPPSQSLAVGNPHSATNLLNNSQSNSNNNNNNNNNNSNSQICTSQIPVMSDRSHQSLHHVPAPPPPLPSSSLITSERLLPSSRDKDSPKSSSTSTYLNGKINTSTTGPVSGFKVPCGKEGSLKHRILTRPPYSERESRRRSPITATIMRSSNGSTAPSNFSKGAFIELSNGVLRKVEDMRTEDFIQSAEKSPYHQLADSTVVKISNTPNSVIITFSYDKNRSKADVEVSQEHPFFVYGQGWASCNPELSLQIFGLKCQRLQVGDVCISLKAREQQCQPPPPPPPLVTALNAIEPSTPPQSSSLSLSSSSSSSLSSSSTSLPFSVAHLYKEDVSPQNLSRKSYSNVNSSTVPTTATGTAVTSRLTAPSIPSHHHHHHHHHLASPHTAYDIQHMYQTAGSGGGGGGGSNTTIQRHHISPPSAASTISGNNMSHHYQLQTSHSFGKPLILSDNRDNRYLIAATDKRRDTELQKSPPLSRPSSNQPFYLGTSGTDINSSSALGNNNGNKITNSNISSGSQVDERGERERERERHHLTPEQQAAVEASLCRKRRWSAPDNICDDEGCPTAASKTKTNP